jgi:hypothetical protein
MHNFTKLSVDFKEEIGKNGLFTRVSRLLELDLCSEENETRKSEDAFIICTRYNCGYSVP